MPVSFLSQVQREQYGRYSGAPTPEELGRHFHLDDIDLEQISRKRGDHNRLGFAVQLCTVRYLGTFLDDPLEVPLPVLHTLSRQLQLVAVHADVMAVYRTGEQRWQHAQEIRTRYGYVDIGEPLVGWRLSRWLYALCWTGTDRPSVLFERATTWLVTHKVLLPGISILERHVARLRSRVERRLWQALTRGVSPDRQLELENLLSVPAGQRQSPLDRLRTGPVKVSGRSLVQSLLRLQSVRELGIRVSAIERIPRSRVLALARYASAAKAVAILRLPNPRRLATLVAFVHCLEASAQDDALDVLDALLSALFSGAAKAEKKARLRTLKDLDQAAAILARACETLLDSEVPDLEVRAQVFDKIPREALTHALQGVVVTIRPSGGVYQTELAQKYKTVRLFLPMLLEHIRFGANAAGLPVVAALDWLRFNLRSRKPASAAPMDVIGKAWQLHVLGDNGGVNLQAYVFCVLEQLHTALKRRDVFVMPSWLYGDPRAGLLDGTEWLTMRPIICRTLDLSITPDPTLNALAVELDRTYRAVAARLPQNPAVRFETVGDKTELVLTALDKLDESQSLVTLRTKVTGLLPRVDLPELILEVAARTGFTEAFTHLSEHTARATDIHISLCAVLMAEACNTGLEPLIRGDVAALKRDRLSWVDQNYLRDDTFLNP